LSKKILIVEDQKFISSIVSLNLRKIGYDTVVAENGKIGYDLAKSEKPDLILLDIMMPVLNGFETLKLLKSDDNTRKIPVIILSALSQKSHILEAISLGAIDYITKPFNLDIAKLKIAEVFKKLNQSTEIEKHDTFPIFYKNYVVVMNCPNDFISLEYIKKISNSITKFKEEISQVILNLKENKTIDNLNVVFFDNLIAKLNERHIKVSLVVMNSEIESFFKEAHMLSTFEIFTEMSAALPPDIDVSEIENTKKITAEDAKYPLPVLFNSGVPIIKFFVAPTPEQIDLLDNCILELFRYNRKRIIVDFNNTDAVPARLAGVLMKYQTNLVIKNEGKIVLIIKSQNLITQLKEGGFITKFEIYTDLESAMAYINK